MAWGGRGRHRRRGYRALAAPRGGLCPCRDVISPRPPASVAARPAASPRRRHVLVAGQACPGCGRRRSGPPGQRRCAGGERGRGRGRSLRPAAASLAAAAAPQRGRAGSPWGARAAPASPRGWRRGRERGWPLARAVAIAPSPRPLGAGLGLRAGLRSQQHSCAREGGRLPGSRGHGRAAAARLGWAGLPLRRGHSRWANAGVRRGGEM